MESSSDDGYDDTLNDEESAFGNFSDYFDDEEKTPIHELSLAIHPQSSSLLYNGLIPPEIRDAIFNYALTDYEVPESENPDARYEIDTDYTRPGYMGKKRVDVALLQTCRRIYMETYHLPPVKKEHVFWHTRGPPFHAGYSSDFNGVHLFTQMFWLEGTFSRLAQVDQFQGLEKIEITIRRRDWWWNEQNHPLGINPQRGDGDAHKMLLAWRAEREGHTIEWDERAWGCAFSHMQNLKEIELDLETSSDNEDQLNAIVTKAQTWRFPASPKDGVELVFSANGISPKWTIWQGPACYWSDRCPYCNSVGSCRIDNDSPNEKCVERELLQESNIGPLCHVASLRWKIKRKDEAEAEARHEMK